MSLRRCLPAALLLALPCAAPGQDVASGPEKGRDVPALKVFDLTGPHQGQQVDYAADRKGKPTVYVYIQSDKWDRPMARFVRDLDAAVKKAGGDAYLVAVWLTDDVDKTKEYLPRAQQSLRLEATALTCYPGDKTGPAGWNVNGDAHLTAVVAGGEKVAATFGYRSLNETDVPAVVAALKKARPEK